MSADLAALLGILAFVVIGALLVAYSPKRDADEFKDDNDRGMW